MFLILFFSKENCDYWSDENSNFWKCLYWFFISRRKFKRYVFYYAIIDAIGNFTVGYVTF